jgi:hypothetical protein
MLPIHQHGVTCNIGYLLRAISNHRLCALLITVSPGTRLSRVLHRQLLLALTKQYIQNTHGRKSASQSHITSPYPTLSDAVFTPEDEVEVLQSLEQATMSSITDTARSATTALPRLPPILLEARRGSRQTA